MTSRWQRQHALLRHPAQVVSQWLDADKVDPALLSHRVQGPWWELIGQLRITLLVTREYEHLVMGLSVFGSRPRVSYLPMPHPSGLAVDRAAGVAYLASTRNPNQVFTLQPIERCTARADVRVESPIGRPLVPVASRVYPGSLYLHDLALVGGVLHGNAVGTNSVVRLGPRGRARPVWWPRCIDGRRGPRLERNYLQLNSIAASDDLEASYFTASCDRIGGRRPGQPSFPVKERGVLYSGRTREPVVRGLTRPHSARLAGGVVWLDNSGYGQVGVVRDDRFEVVAALPGWTRGLCFAGRVAFVGTSRVIPNFRRYAPGLEVARSRCGVHALDVKTGEVIASLTWPAGNQLFGLEAVPRSWSAGFPFVVGARGRRARQEGLFYAFEPPAGDECL
jgi:uncharacterized protein (TIGR03032 family)